MADDSQGLLPSGFDPSSPLENIASNLKALLPSGWNPAHPIDNIITNLGGTVSGDGGDDSDLSGDGSSGTTWQPWVIGGAAIFALLLVVILIHEVEDIV